MYVKIETERLTYICLNQRHLRSEEYIHLRGSINVDGNVNNVGRMTILSATNIGSPRHMHEYAEDAMSYVRYYGHPNLLHSPVTHSGLKSRRNCYIAKHQLIDMTSLPEFLNKN